MGLLKFREIEVVHMLYQLVHFRSERELDVLEDMHSNSQEREIAKYYHPSG
jgi:hypothetical protein